MIPKGKQIKLYEAAKKYCKQYLNGKTTELDESGTRLMINSFLTEVLCFAPIEEIKTEYMIRGTYADYVVQTKGVRHFLVEVKALSLSLSDKHLRQAINYGANEGIEWALLTNGKHFDLYKILFNKPIEWVKVFSIDLCDTSKLKEYSEALQYLHKDSVSNKGLEILWSKNTALDPKNIAGMLYAPTVTNFIKKSLKIKFKNKFSDDDIYSAISRLIQQSVHIDDVKPIKIKKEKKAKVAAPLIAESTGVIISEN